MGMENFIIKWLEVGGLDYMGAEETGQGSGTLLYFGCQNLHDWINFTMCKLHLNRKDFMAEWQIYK